MSVEFIFILEIEVILIVKYTTRFDFNFKFILYINNLLKPIFFISINDTIYTIIANVIQREERVLIETG